MSENKQPQEVSEAVKALQIIQAVVKGSKAPIVENKSNTGFSYFAGKKRLCKLLNTKRGIALEINVQLPKNLGELAGMDTISVAQAKKKHLGTMKHMYRAQDAAQVKAIMAAAMTQFLKELAPAEAPAPEVKPAATEAQPKAPETVAKEA